MAGHSLRLVQVHGAGLQERQLQLIQPLKMGPRANPGQAAGGGAVLEGLPQVGGEGRLGQVGVGEQGVPAVGQLLHGPPHVQACFGALVPHSSRSLQVRVQQQAGQGALPTLLPQEELLVVGAP